MTRKPTHARVHASICAICLLGCVLARAARADDLADALLVAASALPETADGREACMRIDGLGNNLRIPVAVGDQRTAVQPSGGYDANTRGAYLGDAPEGQPPPVIIQALLDAGVAERLPLAWKTTNRVFGPTRPGLRDTGTGSEGPGGGAPPNGVTTASSTRGYAFIVAGPASDLFVREDNVWMAQAPTPPAVSAPDGATVPSGLWRSDKICYPLKAMRVLEYGDVQGHVDGRKQVTAAISFRPERNLDWMRDPRVAGALTGYMMPEEVRVVTFANDGDGWRPQPFAMPLFGPGAPNRTHVVK